MSALSGVIMNHRKLVASLDISRNWLPKEYRYDNWNNASIKGSYKLSPDSILLFGGAGIWLTDSTHHTFSAFSKGLKNGTDNRIISNIVRTRENCIFAASTFDLYLLNEDNIWENISHKLKNKERLVDLAVKDDTLFVVTRSNIYLSKTPFDEFRKIELAKPSDFTNKATLFRTMWLLHSGELFGLAGQLFVDGLGIFVIILCITGIIYFFCPGVIKRKKKKEKPVKKTVSLMKSSYKWHNKIGVSFLVFLLTLFISGMFLRPPLLIAIIRSKVRIMPGTILNDKNPWHDKLRTLRFDTLKNEWILYSSNGFYSFKDLSSTPEMIENTPPVSVMGVTVLEPVAPSGWVVGSFSGLFYWDRNMNLVVDCNTGKIVQGRPQGRPVASNAVSGYVDDFNNKKIVFEYNRGALVFDSREAFAEMPAKIEDGKMSLWHVCLEIHTGRIYQPIIGLISDLYVFLLGLLSTFILISGYIVYRKRKR